MNIWDPSRECISRDELEQLQLERLQATVNRVYKNVVHYRKIFDERGIVPEDFQSLSDLNRLPFTTREDLRLNYPYGMFAVPLREVVRIHSSSGTTSKPIVTGYTRNDVRMWSSVVARVMTAAGVTRDDLVQIAFNYGLFTGAFGLHYGAEAIGASVIPMGTGNTERQIMIVKDYKTTVLVCTPTYALILADRMEQMGMAPKGSSLKLGLFGGEPWSEAMRGEIEARLGLRATDNYGLSEVIGPGVAGECPFRCGMHIAEDAFLPEVIDPHTAEVLPFEREGELVLTTLTKEAFPMIRYRTGDLTRLQYEKCECGRTTVRMEKTLRRSDDMLIIRGVNVFPSQIREILVDIAQGDLAHQIVVDSQGPRDCLEVIVEVTEKIFTLEVQRPRAFLEMFQKRVKAIIGLDVAVSLVEPGSLPRDENGSIRVKDKRRV